MHTDTFFFFLAYGPDNKLDTITDPASRVTTFDHDTNGDLILITDPDNTTRTFSYDSGHHLTSQRSKRDFEIRYDYNFAGRVIKATRQDGSTNLFAPSKLVGLADTANGEGTQTNPLPVVRPSEVQATVTDGNGHVTTYEFDEFGFDTFVIDPLGQPITTDRNGDGKATQITAANGAITELSYDSQGNLLTLKEAVGMSIERQTVFEYDATFSQVTKVIDPEGSVVTLQLDTNGNLLKRINDVGGELTRTYNNQGQVLTNTDENGHTTTFTYDALGNLETVTNPEGDVTQMLRDATGNVLSVEEGVGTPETRTTSFTYDPLNRTTSTTDGTGATTQLRYDSQGNLLETELPTGQIQRQVYDPLNRVLSIEDPLRGTSQFSYDFNGNLLSTTNALTQTTSYEYDADNQLIKVIDPLTNEQVFTYDVSGNIKTVTDALGKVTTFDYDLLNRSTKRTNPLNQEILFTYNARNQVKTITDAKGQLITRNYDSLSRLFEVITPDNTITNTYDALGNLTQIEDFDSRVQFTYDDANRNLTAATIDLGHQPAITLTNVYDAVSNRRQLIDTAPGTTLFDYDLAGRLTKLTTPLPAEINLTYDAAGRLDNILYPNGIIGDYAYDPQGRLESLAHTLGTNPSFTDLDYTYTSVGNIESIADNVTAAQSRSFTYDSLQRVKTGGTTGIPETYDYDPVGNRLSSFLSPTHVHDDAHRLLEDEQFTYSYDANGNLETKTDKVTAALTTYNYDAQNQLVQITFPDSTTALYKYDGFGRRIEKNINGTITRYVYDGQRLVLEFDGSNTFVARYSHGPKTDQPLAIQRAGLGFFYYHADHQGSITHLTDTSGNVANSYLYDSYGRRLNIVESVIQPFTYTGREFDAESGLYYYRARHYDPQTGRFLGEDPIGFDGFDNNLYRYVLNNPINLNDPNGKFVIVVALPAIPALTAGAASALTTAAHVAATVAAAAAGTAVLTQIHKVLNNNNDEGEGEGEGREGDIVPVNPDTGEIMDPKGQTDIEPVVVVDPEQSKKRPNTTPKPFCEAFLNKCLKICNKLCPPKLKSSCIAVCFSAYTACSLIDAPRDVGNF